MSCPKTIRSPYRCKSCDAPFRADTPTNVEVSVYCNFILSLRCPLCGGKNLTLGFNLSQAENEALRIAGTIEQRAQHWHENGEVGTSSLTIFHHFVGSSMEHTSAPADLADLRRCLFLLDHVPEWQSRIGELEAVPGWENLAKNWQKLTDLFRLESPDLRGEAPETDQLLRSLTSKKETTGQ